MAWTTPRTWVSGELATASLFNTHIRDNMTFLLPDDDAQDIAYSASDFTHGTVGGVWDVQSGDVLVQWKHLVANRFRFTCQITNSSVSGTSGIQLRINLHLPSGTIQSNTNTLCFIRDNGTAANGYIFARPGNTYLEVYRRNLAIWAASTNLTNVYFTIPVAVNV